MANDLFRVKNGIEAGPVKIFSSNGAIVTTGNIFTSQTYFVQVNEIITGTEIVAGNMVSNSGTISTNTTTGALVITGEGGIGLGGNIYIGGSGGNAIVSTGDIYNQGNVFVNGTNAGLKTNQTSAYVFNETATIVRIAGAGVAEFDSNLQATSTSTGAIRLAGGMSIATGNLYIGGSAGNAVISTGQIFNQGNISITGANPGLKTNQATAYVFNETATTVKIGGAGVTDFDSNTQATSAATGAIQLTGGMSINTGNLYIGGSGGRAITHTGHIIPSANVTFDIGSTNAWYNVFYGVSTQARYADLAENYRADGYYAPGTVLDFGGSEEVTVSMFENSVRVAGVVSTNPAHLMNGALKGGNVVPLALMGRVPCNVVGTVRKGDLMVSAGYGYAKANPNPPMGAVIGKALQSFDGDKGQIEIVVGRV